LLVYTGSQTVFVQGFLRATLLAPNAEIDVISIGHDPGHVGQLIGKRIEVHQETTIWHRPFTRDDCEEVDASGCGLVFGCAPKDTDGDGLTDCDEDSDLDFFFGPIARFSTVPKPPGRLAAPPRRPAPPSILPQRSTPV